MKTENKISKAKAGTPPEVAGTETAKPVALSTRPHWTGKFFDLSSPSRYVIERSKARLATDAELAQLRKLEGEFQALQRDILDVSAEAVLRDRKAQLKGAMTRDRETVEEFKAADVYTRDELYSEASQKRHIIKATQARISDEARPIAVAIARRLSEAANDIMVDLEQTERRAAEQVGVSFSPSEALQAVAQITWRAHESIGCAGTRQSPARMVQPYGITL